MSQLQRAGIFLITIASAAGFIWYFLSRERGLLGLGSIFGTMGLGASFLAIAHTGRFKAGLVDRLITAALFGAIVVLPCVPLLLQGHARLTEFGHFLPIFLAFFSSALLGFLLLHLDRTTGRYFHGGRELPELEGPARQVADSTLVALGHPALSIRVAPLGSFNALVQGIRHSLVVIDRRAADSLSAEHLGSLLAHEVGHLTLGGVYTNLVLMSGWAAVLTWLGPVIGSVWASVVLLGCYSASQHGFSHLSELFCDRFASHHKGAEATAELLRRIHEDLPSFAQSSLFRSIAGSHPPLRVRLAALGCSPCGVLVSYGLLWAAVIIGFVILPVCALTGRAMGLLTPSPVLEAVTAAPLLYFFFLAGTTALERRRIERASGEKLEPRRRGAWARWLFGLSAAVLFGCALSMALVDPGDWMLHVLIVAFPMFLLSAVIAVVVGAFRSASEQIPRTVRRTLADASGAIHEGHSEESLAIVDAGLERQPKSPQLAALRGTILINLGRTDEAVPLREALREREKGYGMADLNLATAEILRGNLGRADALTQEVLARTPEFGYALYLAALVAYESGILDAVEEKLLLASRVKAKDAQVLAGRALVSLDRGDLALARTLVQEALGLERPSGITLLASALVKKEEGDEEGARESLAAALQRARDRGMPGWIPYYARLAARKGLSLERRAP